MIIYKREMYCRLWGGDTRIFFFFSETQGTPRGVHSHTRVDSNHVRMLPFLVTAWLFEIMTRACPNEAKMLWGLPGLTLHPLEGWFPITLSCLSLGILTRFLGSSRALQKRAAASFRLPLNLEGKQGFLEMSADHIIQLLLDNSLHFA